MNTNETTTELPKSNSAIVRPSPRPLRVGIFGAGAIGTYVGTLLAAAGCDVVLLGRESLRSRRHRIAAVVDDRTIPLPASARVTTSVEDLRDVELCIVSVKSKDTAEAARALGTVLDPSALVVSLQNGLDNPARLSAVLPNSVEAGVVGFNVCPQGTRYQRTVTGPLVLGCGDPRLDRMAEALEDAGQAVRRHEPMLEVMAGKLLLNTNNGVCGVTGLKIRDMMHDADARWCFARCIEEGLAVFEAAGIRPRGVGLVGPRMVRVIARLPNFIVRPLLRLSPVDARADTSTAVDLRRGRTTEIDDLNGALVTMGQRYAVPTPVNRTIVEQVRRRHFAVQRGRSPHWLEPSHLRGLCEVRMEIASQRVLALESK